ncbi:hypothetical protein PROFUN_10090 [Planoprotostelium fungivorum]|uniref:Uncharacterized protein n=1 Tax=Planoprotostelium fungivorum TaxID=1890364 RepID=A0A2P6NEX7_9EUKA|nr:hypothetical protein PROFUN_10090 [Planoprotostelium fungivorum]
MESLSLRPALSVVVWKQLAKIRFVSVGIRNITTGCLSQTSSTMPITGNMLKDHLTQGKAVNYPDLGVWTIRREKSHPDAQFKTISRPDFLMSSNFSRKFNIPKSSQRPPESIVQTVVNFSIIASGADVDRDRATAAFKALVRAIGERADCDIDTGFGRLIVTRSGAHMQYHPSFTDTIVEDTQSYIVLPLRTALFTEEPFLPEPIRSARARSAPSSPTLTARARRPQTAAVSEASRIFQLDYAQMADDTRAGMKGDSKRQTFGNKTKSLKNPLRASYDNARLYKPTIDDFSAKKIELIHRQEQKQKALAKAESIREYNQQLTEQIKMRDYSPERSPEVDHKAPLQERSDGVQFDEFFPNRAISTPERKKREAKQAREQQKEQLEDIKQRQHKSHETRKMEAKDAAQQRKHLEETIQHEYKTAADKDAEEKETTRQNLLKQMRDDDERRREEKTETLTGVPYLDVGEDRRPMRRSGKRSIIT